MREIVARNAPFVRSVMPREEAIAFFEARGEKYKAQLIKDLPATEEISLYSQGEWIDLCRGPHLRGTGDVGTAFKLTKVAGAYWRGDHRNAVLSRIYGTAWRDQKELDAYLTQVEEAPVHALVNTRVVGDRRFGDRGRGHDDRVELDLDAAELDALVVLELAGGGEERALGQARDRVGEGVRDDRALVIRRPRVHQLHRAGLVAQHDELHLLLVAHGVDPAGDGHRPVGGGGQVLDEGALSHPQSLVPRTRP
jgi:hypothetical protein